MLGSQLNELPWPKKINFLPKMSTPILICCKLSPKKNSCIHTLKKQSWCSYWCSSSYFNILTMLPSWSIVTLHVLSDCISYLSHMFCPNVCMSCLYNGANTLPIHYIIPYVLPKKVCMSFLHNGAKYTTNFLAWPHKLKVYYFW